MSYILEALKKLEKERRRERIPGLSEQDSVVYHSQRRSSWPYALIIVFSLNALVLGWWLLPKNRQDSVMTPAPAVRPASVPVKSQDIKDPLSREAGGVTPALSAVKTGVSPGALQDRPEASQNIAQPVKAAIQEDAQKAGSSGRSEPEDEKLKKSEIAEGPLPDRKLYKLAELPPSVRESLQKFLTITAFMYSNTPSERMVRINERIMREGQELDPGIRIEEIVPEGVILSYRKFRFIVSLQ